MANSIEADRNRVYIRMPPGLKEEMQAYAKRHKVKLSTLTLEYYRSLLAQEQKFTEVDQI